MKRILIIDDDRQTCMILNRFLTRNGFEAVEVYSGKAALAYVKQNGVDAVLCDYRLEDMNGKEVLAGIKEINFNIPVIIITGYTDVKAAVEVTKMGAYDYVTKPLLPDEILLTIKKSLDKSIEKPQDNSDTASKSKDKAAANKADIKLSSNDYILGNSVVFNNIITQVKRVAPTNFSVILYGESGCGKEVIAQTIHQNSKRANKPFIAIDCGALSKELASSELFGHEKGSFTGAINHKVGSLELANGGTIFLDEIANLSYDIQVSLLRVVQERKIRRIGGTTDIEIDVRIIVASNERLMEAAKKGKFREDLFHRFNEFSIDVPPLRERSDDILLFANHFLHQTALELEKNVNAISPAVQQIFMHYAWPGNLRELKNIIKRSVLLTDTNIVDINVLPFEIVNYSKLQFDEPAHAHTTNEYAAVASQDNSTNAATQPSAVESMPQTTDGKITINDKSLKAASLVAEYNMIVEALKQANYNKSKAARILNIDRKTLYNKMEEHKLLILD